MADAQYAHFETMTNVELRAELKRRGCPTSGNKKDLLAKLRAALQKEENNNNNIDNSVGNTQNQTDISTPMISVEQQQQTVDKSSEDSSIITNQENLLEISNNVNEVNSFVSKSNEIEEEEKSIEKLGDHTHLPVVADSSESQADTSESIVKENTSNDEQPQHSIEQTENKESIEIVPIETIKENESLSTTEKQTLKINRSQSISSVKFPIRSISNKINLNLELLQTLISDVSLLPESVVNDELDSDQNNESLVESNLSNDFQSADSSMTIGDLADQKLNRNRTVAIDDLSTRKKSNSISTRIASFEGKNNGILADEPVRIKEPTITNEPPSDILYIRGLTRPFSLMQLKGLLSRYGTLVDGEFWLDKIKSQCFVRYNTIEDAQNARQELDGCRWPSTNPKTLSIRFARQDEIEYSKTHDAPPDHLANETTDRIVEEKISNIDDETPSKPYTNGSKPLKEKQSAFLITDVEDIRDDEENIDEQPTVKSTDQPAKGLDDYFRKTKAKPSIYWLPLTDEQIIERIRRQEQRKAERDEEQRKRNLDENQRQNEKRRRSVSPSRRDSKRH